MKKAIRQLIALMIRFTVLRVTAKTSFSPKGATIITNMMVVMMRKNQILKTHRTRKTAVGHITGTVRTVRTI